MDVITGALMVTKLLSPRSAIDRALLMHMMIMDAMCAKTVTSIEIHNLLDPIVVGRMKYVRAMENSSTMTACPMRLGLTASRRIIEAASVWRGRHKCYAWVK